MAPHNRPVSGLVTPRFGGIATFMRLPHVPLEEAKDLDIGLVGIPWDGGTTNRPGPRHAPRQMHLRRVRVHALQRLDGLDVLALGDERARSLDVALVPDEWPKTHERQAEGHERHRSE